MITSLNIRNVIKETVAGFDIERLDEDEDFNDAGIDSLDHLSILLALEEEFNIEKIPDEAIDDCKSISGIINYLNR